MKLSAIYRREKPKFAQSVYFDVVVSLPEQPAENDGYHTSCYQSFTAVQVSPPPAEKLQLPKL